MFVVWAPDEAGYIRNALLRHWGGMLKSGAAVPGMVVLHGADYLLVVGEPGKRQGTRILDESAVEKHLTRLGAIWTKPMR